MKKFLTTFITLLLTVLLVLFGSAAELILGDITGDGEIKAADARLVLRFAAQIETPTNAQAKAADVDNNGVINAADARKVLRLAAKLDNGDDNELPVQVKLFVDGKYYLTGTIYSGGEAMPVKIATDGKNIQLTAVISNSSISILQLNNSAYFIIPSQKVYAPLTNSLLAALGITNMNSSDFIGMPDSEKAEKVQQEECFVNGSKGFCTTFIYDDCAVKLYSSDDKLVRVDNYDVYGNLTMTIAVDSITARIPSDQLTLNGMQIKTASEIFRYLLM